MSKRTVVDPFSRNKIVVGGDKYKDLISRGYVEKHGSMIKKYDSESDSSEDFSLSDDGEYDLRENDDDEQEIDYNYDDDDDDNLFMDNDDLNENPSKSKKYYDEEELYNANEKQVIYTSKYPVYSDRPRLNQDLQRYTEDFPFVRCECGKPIGFLAKRYERLKEQGYDEEEIYAELNLSRFCCKKNMTYQQQLPTVFVNEKKLGGFDEPAAKVVRVGKNSNINNKNSNKNIKKSKKKSSSSDELDDNPFLTGKKGKKISKKSSSSDELDDNPYLTGKITKELKKMDINKRTYEGGFPVSTNFNIEVTKKGKTFKKPNRPYDATLLPSRKLSDKMYVSYLGK